GDRRAHHLERMFATIDAGDVRVGAATGNQLVGDEVVLEAFDQDRGNVFERAGRPPYVVVLEDRDYLVVRFAGVDHLQTADHAGADDHLALVDGPFAEHADVQRVAVAALRRRRQPA